MSNFHPYVLVETAENRPSSLSVAAWTGNQFRYLDLPSETTEDDLVQIQELVRASHSTNRGIAFNFGKVIGYRVVFSPDESILLNTSAEVLSRQRGTFWPRTINPSVEP